MNQIFQELKITKKWLLIWFTMILFFIAICLFKFDMTATQTTSKEITQMINQMPKALQVILGFYSNLDISQLNDYFIICFQYIMIFMMFFGWLLGTLLIQREKETQTIDFLFTKPISRKKIYANKWFTGLMIQLGLFICMLIISIGTGLIVSHTFSIKQMSMHIALLSLIGFIYYHLGFNLSIHKRLNLIGIILIFIDISIDKIYQLFNIPWLKYFSIVSMFSPISKPFSIVSIIFYIVLLSGMIILYRLSNQLFQVEDK